MYARHRFEQELTWLHSNIVRMGVEVENSIRDTLKALQEDDAELAEEIIKNDDVVDKMERDTEKLCIDLIARQQPVARDLRSVTSALKLITDLERIADHAADISELILSLHGENRLEIPGDISLMGRISKEMLKGALDSYISKDIKKAQEVIERDDKVDELYLNSKSQLAEKMKKDPGNIEQYIEQMLICKYLERIADHAQNIAEWVVFLISGEHE